VIVVSGPERVEESLRAGQLPCPRCRGAVRPFGHGRTRTVRGVGATTVTVTPRRVRCADCRATHIVLPAELMLRRADSTEVIGHALIAKARGAGFRAIAARLGRPPSTVRRWLRRVPADHVERLHQRAVQVAVRIDPELLGNPFQERPASLLERALGLFGATARRYRDRFGWADSPWALVGMFTGGQLLAPPLII
jgi:hypothetical protein